MSPHLSGIAKRARGTPMWSLGVLHPYKTRVSLHLPGEVPPQGQTRTALFVGGGSPAGCYPLGTFAAANSLEPKGYRSGGGLPGLLAAGTPPRSLQGRIHGVSGKASATPVRPSANKKPRYQEYSGFLGRLLPFRQKPPTGRKAISLLWRRAHLNRIGWSLLQARSA